jgi:hypothetical protein
MNPDKQTPDYKNIQILFMRTENTNLFVSISNDHISQMAKEVKETVAADMSSENCKPVFSAADLWRIQKNRRMRVQRRMIF